jgi:L-lysine 6-transaminase
VAQFYPRPHYEPHYIDEPNYFNFMTKQAHVSPGMVHDVLNKHILADGFDIVLDLEKSQGPYLYDSKYNKKYLDFFTFFASNPVGMNHPKMVGDKNFMDKIAHVAAHNPSNSDVYTTQMAEFVDTFDRVGIPSYMPHAFFVAGGALAVENALKVAFDWKVQKNFRKGYRQEKGHMILHFDQAFHGRTGYTMSLTNTEPNKVAYFPKFAWPRMLNPKIKFPLTAENIAITSANEKIAIAQAEMYFHQHRDDIAAIIVEPIQGEGGDNHFTLNFHNELRRLADENDALLIHDEVQTGVGLTGKFWAHQHYVQPDILAFGKKAQVCGILAGTRIDDIETNVFHKSSRINSTWGGNLVDMVRFQKYLEIIEEDDLLGNATTVGAYLLEHLAGIEKENEFIVGARGKGLMCAFDLPNTHARNAVVSACYDNGLMILPCGTNTIRFRPPLNITEEQIDEGTEIIKKSIEEATQKCPAISVTSKPEPKSV